MNLPVAIADDSAKDILALWQSLLSRHEIEALISNHDQFARLLVPASQMVQARKLLFNRP